MLAVWHLARAPKIRKDLHAAAKTRLLADLPAHILVIVMICESDRAEHTEVVRRMKTTQGTLDYYKAQTRYEWMASIKSAVMPMRDLTTSGRAGFVVDFDGPRRKACNIDSDLVRTQDALAAALFRVVGHCMCERVPSMLLHTHNYPLMLAPAALDSPVERKAVV